MGVRETHRKTRHFPKWTKITWGKLEETEDLCAAKAFIIKIYLFSNDFASSY